MSDLNATPVDWLSIAREAFTSSTTFFDSSIRAQVEAGIRQFQGVHPAGSKYHSDSYKAKSRLFRPKPRSTIRKNEAVAAEAYFANNDQAVVEAEDDDNPQQQASAEIMKALLDYRLKKSVPWFLIAMGAYQDAQAVGVCISHQYWKYDLRSGVDKPAIDLLPVENLRIDAAANWADPINTSPYVIELIPMYVKDVKARMATPDPKTGGPRWKPMAESQILAAMNASSDTTRQVREAGRTDSKQESTAVREFAIVWVHKNIIEINGQDVIYFTLGTFGLLTDPVPLNEVYFHGRRPYVMGCCILETHKIYPNGVTGITKDISAEINEVANQRIDNVKFAMNKRYFAQRGAQVDLRSLTRNTPGSVTLMNNIEKDVKVVDTPDVTASAYKEQDMLNLDFDDVAGAFSSSSIQSNRALNETVGGMKLLDVKTNQVSAYQLMTFNETWAEPVLEQMVLLEQFYETDEVVIAKAGRQSPLFQKMGHDKVTDELLMQELTVRVNIGMGATSPAEQLNNFVLGMRNLREILADGLLEKYGLDISEVIKELFSKLGYRDGKRFFAKGDPALRAAQATILQLQDELAKKVSPELVAAQVKKLDAEIEALSVKNRDVNASAVQKTMATLFASGQTAQMVAAVPALAPLMDALAQLAGYTQPVPAGVDPDIPALAAGQGPAPMLAGPAGAVAPDMAAGLTQNAVKNPKTGIQFTPGVTAAQTPGAEPGSAGDTTPLTPALPSSPLNGSTAGMTTMRPNG